MSFNKRDSRPTPQDAARRLLILKHIVASAFAAPPRDLFRRMTSQWNVEENTTFQQQAELQRDQFWEGFRMAGLWQYLSPSERAHAQSTMATMTERQQIDGWWRIESAQTLMWALHLLPELPPYDTAAEAPLLKQIPAVDMAVFIQSAVLRDSAELDQARETAEFWHWRSRTRDLIERGDPFPADEQMKSAGFHNYDDVVRFSARNASLEAMIPPCIAEDFPAKGKAYRDLTGDEWTEVRSITVERHYALNWLCGYAPDNKWDETPTDT